MSDPCTVPLFPLSVVLFPRGPLPLRIFETRYTDMVRRCLREDTPFGVVQVHTTAASDGTATLHRIGTLARIVDFNPLPDGLLGITCRGGQRFEVLSVQRQEDGLNIGQVRLLPVAPTVPVPPQYAHFVPLLQRVLPELGGLYDPQDSDWDDADWVGCRMAEVLPLQGLARQQLLALNDPVQRLGPLAAFLAEAMDGDDEDDADDDEEGGEDAPSSGR